MPGMSASLLRGRGARLRRIAAVALALLALGACAMEAHAIDEFHHAMASYQSDLPKWSHDAN